MLYNFFYHLIDQPLATFLLAHRSEWGIKFFALVSYLGNWQFLVSAIVLVFLWLLILKQRRWAMAFLGVNVVTEVLVFFIKLLSHRDRPGGAVFEVNSFSFPSGHAAMSLVFFGALAYVLIKFWSRKYYQLIIITASVLVVLVGFSRLYLGVHYFSDVFFGYLLGALVLFSGIYLAKK